MQPNSQNSLGDRSLRSHRSQYTEHHPTEPAAYSDNTYREVEANEPEDISETRGVRTSRQYIESSDEREVEEADDAQNEEEEDDDVNSEIEDEHLEEEEHHNKTSLPDVEEEEEEEDADDAENDDEPNHKEESQKPIEHEYQSFGDLENNNKPAQPPVTPVNLHISL